MAIPPLRLRSMPMPPQTSSSLLLVTIGDGLFNYFLSLKGEKACGSQKIGQYPPVLLVLLVDAEAVWQYLRKPELTLESEILFNL